MKTAPRLLFLLSLAVLLLLPALTISRYSKTFKWNLEDLQIKEWPPETEIVLQLGRLPRFIWWIALGMIVPIAGVTFRGHLDRALPWLTGSAISLLFALALIVVMGLSVLMRDCVQRTGP